MPISVMSFLTPAQIADVTAGTASLDLTAPLQGAINTRQPLYWPAGVYRHDTPLALLPVDPNIWTGEGLRTEIRAGAVMTGATNAQVVKATRAGGGTTAPVCMDGISFNANRLADTCLSIGISMRGWFRNMLLHRFKATAFIGGDDTSGSSFYENEIRHVQCFAGDGYTSFTSWPARGIFLDTTATDNVLTDIVCSYMTDAAVETMGGMNTFGPLHAYGDVITGTHPLKVALLVKANTIVTSIYCDSISQAGIRIEFNGSAKSLNVAALQTYHAAAPAAGQFAALEIASGAEASAINIGPINCRGANASDPAIRWLGTTFPRDVQYSSISGMAAPINMGYANVKRQLSISGVSGVSSFFSLETAEANKNAFHQWKVNCKLRFEMGKTNADETGGNIGSNFNLAAYADDGATKLKDFLIYFRASDSLTLSARVQIGSTSDRVAFYGGTPIVKRTGTPADATDLATALTLVNALKTHLVAYGLVS